MKDCREKKEEDCRKEWRIVGESGGLYFGGAERRGTSSLDLCSNDQHNDTTICLVGYF